MEGKKFAMRQKLSSLAIPSYVGCNPPARNLTYGPLPGPD
jgi:hypothetical protein